jgi:hypothetical protein
MGGAGSEERVNTVPVLCTHAKMISVETIPGIEIRG